MTSRSLFQCLLNTPWKYILLMPLYFTFLVKVLPPPFHYSLGSYLYLFFIHFPKSKLMAISVPVLKLPEEKCIIPSSRHISVIRKSSICRKYRHKNTWINNIQPVFTATVLPTLKQIYQISSYSSQSLRGDITA